MLSLGGCFGRFPLTRAVYNGNRNIYDSVEGSSMQRKLAQSVVMWLFIPVYAGTSIGDVVVFNLIEFWTGSQTNLSYNQEKDGTRVALSPSADGREVTLTLSRDTRIVAQKHFVRISETEYEIRNPYGQIEGRVIRGQDGSLSLTDAEGRVFQNVSAQELATLGEI
ncbi:MAG TPA: DUF3332 family protein [Candidatus Sumerlaeota bacterium]|nr:DUF3332 family protein [Candidatus Sumerlaeota bacterium]